MNRAAALVESQGKAAAFAQFRSERDSAWWFDPDLFAQDQNLNVLLNPADLLAQVRGAYLRVGPQVLPAAGHLNFA